MSGYSGLLNIKEQIIKKGKIEKKNCYMSKGEIKIVRNSSKLYLTG